MAIAATAAPPQEKLAASGVQDWVKANAIRLATPEAGHGFADMQPLKKMVGSARIVALGEATHGTREFFQLKHRMMEFLASEMGFTLFSIEANMPEAYRLNDYVLKGTGDPARLIKGMYFWTWDTEEVLAMVKWMREFNQSGKGRVEFTGFDMQTPTVALQIATDFLKKHDDSYAAGENFQDASKMALAPPPPQQAGAGAGFGLAVGSFPVKDAAGKHLRFSGYIKTEGITKGYAGLWWRTDGPTGENGRPVPLGFDNMQERGPKGTTDWTRYEINLDIPKEAVNINFGVLFPAKEGEGTAWFDDLRVELDGKPYESPNFDFDFESPRPKGFGLSGNGYQAQVDSAVFHGGKQSLRMKSLGAPPKPSVDFAAASDVWKGIVAHMEASRAAYGEGNDTEWAIQNARVVLQCMQMRANQVTRDASMAANVKWILDQNPKSKIVLWAHNGHVAHGGYGGYEPMGASLRRMYGEQMVVFGFGFNEGSFQAVEMSKGLHDFTVPPSPAGSLDAMLASAEIPTFALDLRRLPKEGSVADWFRTPRPARSVGAVYSEEQAANYLPNLVAPDSFDALLFVSKTTAARKNPAAPPVAAGEYKDMLHEVSFKPAGGVRFFPETHWGDQETTVPLETPVANSRAALYYRIMSSPRSLSPEEARRNLSTNIDAKVKQRLDAGLKNYRIRPDSCRPRVISGRAAMSCVADFEADGKAQAEYLTYVISDKATALFFAACADGQLEELRSKLDPVIETLRIP